MRNMKLFFEQSQEKKNSLFYLWTTFLILSFVAYPTASYASDGATEALQLRYQAEVAIAQEQAAGHAKMAKAMTEALPGLLQEYLVTRDGSIALDTVDAAFVQEQFKVARAMEEPGVALALDVFSGSGTGYEHGLRTSIANLADFNVKMADRVSEAALDAHERIMERQVEKLEQHLAEFNETKLEAKLNTTAERLEEKTLESEPVQKTEEKTETRIQTVVDQTEAKVEQLVEKTEQLVEAHPEKAETIVEKAEARIAATVEKAETKIQTIVSQAESKLETLSSAASTTEGSTGRDKSPEKGKK